MVECVGREKRRTSANQLHRSDITFSPGARNGEDRSVGCCLVVKYASVSRRSIVDGPLAIRTVLKTVEAHLRDRRSRQSRAVVAQIANVSIHAAAATIDPHKVALEELPLRR